MPTDTRRRRIRLRDLETLIAVVQWGSMRKATQSVHLSQPAVSRAVRDLEEAVGVRLLQRGARGIEPTEFGDSLVRRAKAMLDELQSGLHELEQLADPGSGIVRLGCMETLHAGLVSATVARVLRRHPRMRFVTESGQAADLITHFLHERLVDFVVARPPTLPLPPEVDGEPLFRDQLLVAVGRSHPMAKRRRIGLAELQGNHWILSRNEIMSEAPLHEAFARAGLEMPSHTLVSGSLNARYSLLETGRFVTLIPHSLLPFGRVREHLQILPIELPIWRTHTMILTLRGRVLAPAALRFLDELRALARPLDLEATARPRSRHMRQRAL